MWSAAVSRAVDQSSMRNKRDDRLVEGHDRGAGAGTVLRERKQCALLSTLERVGKYLPFVLALAWLEHYLNHFARRSPLAATEI
jgi:hypothetical protein